jgi:hypothetical protein
MTKEEIKDHIKLEFFKRLSDINHQIDGRWFNTDIYPKLNPKQKEFVEPAVEELVKEGFVTIGDKRILTLILTEQGFEELYPESEESIIGKLQKTILKEFERTNSKVNYVLQGKYFNLTLNPYLNPKERKLVDTAINDMIEQKLVAVNQKSGGGLVLLHAGFDILY